MPLMTKVQWSVPAVGETAGRVWEALHRLGKTTTARLERDVDVPKPLVQMAIGWLAREGKIALQDNKRAVDIWLTD